MKKDLRAGFAQVDKAYAYAKVDTRLNVRESGSTSARIVGTLPAKALCFVIADADQEWVYIESATSAVLSVRIICSREKRRWNM